MRDIKFRGKSTITGEWVYGYYYNMDDNRKGNRRHIIVYESDGAGLKTVHEPVIAESVSQYTGLKDRNKKDIFKGDLLKDRDGNIRCIKYDNYDAGYCLHEIGTNGFLKGRILNNIWTVNQGIIQNYEFEVIDNIQENPNLIF